MTARDHLRHAAGANPAFGLCDVAAVGLRLRLRRELSVDFVALCDEMTGELPPLSPVRFPN
jgi:hypothetical protein